ncbi:MAG: TolC family protein [Bacteroidales bacterium]
MTNSSAIDKSIKLNGIYLCRQKKILTMQTRKFILLSGIAAIMAITPNSANAQSKQRSIDLQAAIDSAFENNDQIRRAVLDRKISSEQFKQTNAIFLPTVDLSHTALFSNDPLNAFGFKLQQQSVTMADFDPSKLNDPGFSKNFISQVELMQPLLNVDAIYQRKGANQMKIMNHWSEQRTREYVVFMVTKSYMETYLAHQSLEVMQKALETARMINHRSQDMYDQGLITNADLLDAKIYVKRLETDVATAKSNIRNSSDQLSLLMGEQPGEEWYIGSLPQISLSDTDASLEGRSDIMALNSALKAMQYKTSSEKMSLIPRINAFGSYSLHDTKPFRFNNDSYMIGVKLSWRIFSGTQDFHKIKAAKLEQTKMANQVDETLKQAQADIAKNKRALNDIEFEIQQGETMVKQANESMSIMQDRYQQGLVTTADLLRSQTQLAERELGLQVAYFKKGLTIAYLKLLTSTK